MQAKSVLKANGKVKTKLTTVDVADGEDCPKPKKQVKIDGDALKGEKGDQGDPGPAFTLAYAKTQNPNNPNIRSFGGSAAESAEIDRGALGFYTVTFKGTFTDEDTFANLVPVCSNLFNGTCSAFISNDTTIPPSDEIDIGIFTRNADGDAADLDFSIMVLRGMAP